MFDDRGSVIRARRRRALGVALVSLGMTMVGASGLCTSFFAGTSIIGLLDPNESEKGLGYAILTLSLFIGGPMILLGALLWWVGARLRGPK